jgi:hypothetical protein
MVTTKRLRALAVASVLAMGPLACASVLGFERLSEESADAQPPAEGGPRADAEAGGNDAGPPPRCDDIGVVAQPVLDGGEDADIPPVHVAVRLIDFGIDTAQGAPGFNLDKQCTIDRASATCTTNVDDPTFATYSKDVGATGIDNSGFSLLSYLAVVSSAFSPKGVNERLQAGEFGIVARVSRWNGAIDDDDVLVELFPAVGVWKQGPGGLEDGGKPAFDAKDRWMRDERFQLLAGLDNSKIKSVNAWIHGGRLAAFFQEAVFPISVPNDDKPLDIRLREAWLGGDVAIDGAGPRLTRGVFGGRWKTSDFLSEVRQIYIEDTLGLRNTFLCQNAQSKAVYDAVKKNICDGRDIRAASNEDKTNKPCDALSAGLRFEAYLVDDPGDFLPAPSRAERCVDAAVPANDDCAP